MIPLLLVGRADAAVQEYIDNFIIVKKLKPPQIFVVKPDKKELSIGQIRQIKKEIIITSGSRLYIISYFDTATIEAQNAFLKTLEEKNKMIQFILVVQNEQKLLPTILSRVKRVVLHSHQSFWTEKVEKQITKLISEVITGSTTRFLANPDISSITKVDAYKLIDNIIYYFQRQLWKKEEKAISILKKSLELRYLIENNNLNSQLAVDNLLIFIWRKYRMK